MAGIPPLIGFFSKQFVLYAALQNGFYLTSILAIIVSVISASYYLKIVKLLISENENETDTESESTELLGLENSSYAYGENKEVIGLTNVHSFIISTLTLILLLFFIKPSLILNSTQLLSLSLFYT
jgi:NADH-ubiquinone oxidoreductase chain 2